MPIACITRGIEMIAGTVVLEDLSISYMEMMHMPDESPRVFYRVANANSGEQFETYCDAHIFMRALGLALNYEGIFPGLTDGGTIDRLYAECESIQPANPSLRWIP